MKSVLMFAAFAFSLLSSSFAGAQSENSQATAKVSSAIQEVRSDIGRAVSGLNDLQRKIAKQRGEFADRTGDLRQQLTVLENQYEQLATENSAYEKKRKSLEQAIQKQENGLKRVGQIISEYRQTMTAHMTGASAQAYRDNLDAIDIALSQPTAAETIKSVRSILDLGLSDTVSGVGGACYSGRARNVKGRIFEGEFIEFGPVAYFRSNKNDLLTGIAFDDESSLIPVITEQGGESNAAVGRLFAGRPANLPFDPTMGSAWHLQQSRESLWGHLRKGKAVMIPLLILGVVCGVIAIYKFIHLIGLTSSRSIKKLAAVLDAVYQSDTEQALKLCDRLRKPLDSVIEEGVKHREASKEHLEEIMYEKLISQTPALERLLSPLAVCASAAPLLGLLGTVTGMIHTFRLITVFGTGDARVLSSGISEALITTEVGLMIAIPALLVHAYLSRRVRRAVSLTQQTAVAFVNRLKIKDNEAG